MEGIKYQSDGGPQGEPCLINDPHYAGNIVSSISDGAFVPGLFGSLTGGRFNVQTGRFISRHYIDSNVQAAAAFLLPFSLLSGGIGGFSSVITVGFFDDGGFVPELEVSGYDVDGATIPWSALTNRWVEFDTCWAMSSDIATAGASAVATDGYVSVRMRTSLDGLTWADLGVVVEKQNIAIVADEVIGNTPMGYASAMGFAGFPGKCYFAQHIAGCDHVTDPSATTPLDPCCGDSKTPGGGSIAPDGTPTPSGSKTNTTVGTFSYEAPTGNGLLTAATDPTDPQDLDGDPGPVVHAQFTPADGQVRYWGQQPIDAGNVVPITARVKSYTEIPTETLADHRGSIPSPGFTVTIEDPDKEVRGWATTGNRYLLNRFAKLLVEKYTNRQLDVAARALSAGYVARWSYLSELLVDLQFADLFRSQRSSLSLLKNVPKETLTRNMFPKLPDDNVGRPVPGYYGEVSDDYNWSLDHTKIPVGIIPGIYLGPGNSFNIINAKQGFGDGTGWGAWLLSKGAMKKITSTFMWSGYADIHTDPPTLVNNRGRIVPGYAGGVIVDIADPEETQWSSIYMQDRFVRVQGADGTIGDYTIVFLRGPRNFYAVNGQFLPTFNGWGFEATGDGTGELIRSASHQLAHFIINFVFGDYRYGNWPAIPTLPDGTPVFERASVDRVRAIHDARLSGGYETGWGFGTNGSDVKSGEQWAAALQVGTDIQLGLRHTGAMLMDTLDENADTTTLTEFDQTNINEFTVNPDIDSFQNAMSYDAGPEPATGRMSLPVKRITDPTSITNWGETREGGKWTNIACRRQNVADNVAQKALAYEANVPIKGSFITDFRALKLRAGQLIKVSSEFGLGTTGWTTRILRTTAVFALANETEMRCRVQWEDVNDRMAVTALQAAIFTAGGLSRGPFWGQPIGSNANGTSQPLGSTVTGSARRLR